MLLAGCHAYHSASCVDFILLPRASAIIIVLVFFVIITVSITISSFQCPSSLALIIGHLEQQLAYSVDPRCYLCHLQGVGARGEHRHSGGLGVDRRWRLDSPHDGKPPTQ